MRAAKVTVGAPGRLRRQWVRGGPGGRSAATARATVGVRRVLRRRPAAIGRDESGQVLLLGIGLTAVVLALILVIASATAVQLDLKRLAAMADSAAARAAEGVDSDGYYGGATTAEGDIILDEAAARAEAQRDLASQPVRGGLSEVQLAEASSGAGATAVVTLTANSQPPFLPWDVIPSDGFRLQVTSTAHLDTVP